MNRSAPITYAMIESLLPKHKVSGNKELISFSNIKAIGEADASSLVFITKGRTDKEDLARATKAKVILIDGTDGFSEELVSSKAFIIVADPKLVFSIIGNKYFTPEVAYTIHPTAVIHPEAKISGKVSIGPNCVVGKGVIEEGTVIYGNVFIYDNFHIGRNVKINAGTVIGAEGFGYNKDENGIPVQFPHIGGVIIEDDVEIGANTCIDRGSLSNTLIKKGAKIDNLVHIAHNVVVGENAYVIANAMIGGSTKIGDHAYIAPSVSLRDQINIGESSFIGMSASVLKDVPDNETWTGSPAQSFEKIKLLNEKLKKL